MAVRQTLMPNTQELHLDKESPKDDQRTPGLCYADAASLQPAQVSVSDAIDMAGEQSHRMLPASFPWAFSSPFHHYPIEISNHKAVNMNSLINSEPSCPNHFPTNSVLLSGSCVMIVNRDSHLARILNIPGDAPLNMLVRDYLY